ncbi:putative thioredoxin [Choristoneura rosaceana entomopoxvirus 'L']|uniref:Thioredoxin n=1 Tax=Choristoneura rosaceana entomopoxvirus 'L' TaxID=1293539 RepID=A0ABM9QKF0_9POXV|nr:putative thioredoxin [Choristoneura rosaceana entomopoxvirus 'L']CCU56006.1 putative thioredoxin [Choristoneura rosaceana entomopoxvirus 'L']
MDEQLYYIPDLCKNCHKLNPENVLVMNGTYRAAYNDYYYINDKLPMMKTSTGGLTKYPKKLFIRNGHYK